METEEFFKTMFSPYGDKGYINLRVMDDVTRKNLFVPLPDYARAAKLCAAYDKAGYDVYYGVLPRVEATDGKKANVKYAAWAWADIDCKNGTTESEAMRLAGDADIIVNSGGGVHAYWRGTPVVTLDKKALRSFEDRLESLQKRIRSDSVHDVTRILRVPGTHNYKYDPPREVTVVKYVDAGGAVTRRINMDWPASRLRGAYDRWVLDELFDLNDPDEVLPSLAQWASEMAWCCNARMHNDEVNARRHQRIANLFLGDFASGNLRSPRNRCTGAMQ